MITDEVPIKHNDSLVDYHLMWKPPLNLNQTDISHYIVMDRVKSISIHTSLREVIFETNITTTKLKILAIDRCGREGASGETILSTPSNATKAVIKWYTLLSLLNLSIFIAFFFHDLWETAIAK